MRRFTALLIPLILSAAPKTVTNIAGTGVAGFSGDGGPGVDGQTNNPYGLVIGPDGALYFCEIGNHRVRRLDLKTHVLSTYAGSGKKGYSGDGGPATAALLNEPYEVRFDKAGNMYFVEMQNHVLRKVDGKTKIISTVAGNGSPGFAGDGGPAAKAQFNQPHSIAVDPDGNLLICDIRNNRIRKVDLKTGMIDTFAGTGERKPTPDGAPLAGTALNEPRALDLDPKGNMYLALRAGNAVYMIDAKTKTIHHLAGTGKSGYKGDGGPAKEALLSGPKGISWSKDGGVYIADTESHTIRRIDLKSGVITTVLGTGQKGDGPLGKPLECKLARPHGVYVHKGIVYVDDSESHRVLMLK